MKSYFLVFLEICFVFGFSTPQENNQEAICEIIKSMPYLSTLWGSPPCNISEPFNCTNYPSLTCSNQLVTTINLPHHNINGTIPTQIGLLTALTTLNLNNNLLNGTLPTQIGYLTALQNIYLDENPLSGTIPTQIGQMTALTILYFDQNQFTGTIPTQIGQLVRLNTLTISNVGINGTIPTQIGQLPLLTVIDIENTRLSGSIPSQLGYKTSLEKLTLNNNNKLCGCVNKPMTPVESSCHLTGVIIACNCSLPPSCKNFTANCTQDTECYTSDCQVNPWAPWGYCENGVQNRTRVYTGDVNNLYCLRIVDVQNCSRNFSEDSPNPIPEMIMTPLPSPVEGIIPIPIPVPIPVPITPTYPKDCQNDYTSLFFVCTYGIWLSFKDIILTTGIILEDASFNLSGVNITGNVQINSCFVIINKNLVLGSNALLTLQNTKLVVKGDLQILSGATLIFYSTSSINISGCAILGGNLKVIFSLNQPSPITILTAHCITGTFSNVNVTLLGGNTCFTYQIVYENSVSIFFRVQNNCGEIPYWVWIIVGLVILIAVLVIVVGVITSNRKKKRLLKELRGKIEMGTTKSNHDD